MKAALYPIVVLAVLIAFLLAGCRKPKTEGEVCGTYLADYDVAKEKLILNPDGTFVQEVTLKANGKADTTKGPWTYNAATGYVTFKSNFMLVLDGFHKLQLGYENPQPGAVMQPVDLYFGATYLGADEGVLYKRK